MSYQLRATVQDDVAEEVKKLCDRETRSESNMVEVLVKEALASRKRREKAS